MKRTPISDRTLPDYTRGEEIFNMVTHIVGGGLGVVALVLCVIFSALHRDAWAVVGCSVYGASMIAPSSAHFFFMTAMNTLPAPSPFDSCAGAFWPSGRSKR